ncbi:70 kDa neurofilament protein [Taenia crassiceps]|uniref:70 kDa neurofilament protein n=1 Tax=Taenia crassiceps TaxID=6207 RepID=A0ABR4QQY5_9CEST
MSWSSARTNCPLRVPKPVVYTKSLETGKQSTRPYSAGGRSQDSGFITYTGTVGSDQEGSELSPPLPVYSWESTAEEVAVKPRPIMSLRSTSRSMERLSRSAFELDIPDMRTTREERERSRREMRELNEKLAEQVEGMRYLSARNRQLTDEISNLKSRWLTESEKTKEIYEGELRQLRQLLDDADREKAESLAKLLSLQKFSRNQETQMNSLTEENDKVKRRLEQAFDDMHKRDNDLNALQRRFNDLECELEKERMNSEKLRHDNETICQHLDEETANRISGQSEMQTLREEIDFMRRAHQEEIREMHRTLDEVGRGFDREMWQTELSQAVHDIQNRYDDQLEKLRVDMEEMYSARLRELGKVNPEQKAELTAIKSENSRLKQNLDGMREQMAQLQSKNAYLEKAMRDVSAEAEELRRRIEVELAESAKEREAAEEALAKAHSEMAALMDVKLNLEGEIAAYRRLLDAQGGILSGGGVGGGGTKENAFGSTQRIRSSREVLSKPRPSSMSPQRRAVAPAPSSDIAHRFHERSDPSGSSFRSRVVEFDGESEQQLSCSYKPERADQRTLRGELTARTQFDKSYKGAISIDECSPDGRYIVITNNGNTAENLNGWRIVRNIEHGKQIIRFTFGDTPMLPKSSRKIWARGQRGLDAGPKDLESPYSTWGVGGYIYTTLFTMDGEERATHAQRAEFNLN